MMSSVLGGIWPNTDPPTAPQTTYYNAIDFETSNASLLWVDRDVSFSSSTLTSVFTSTSFTSTGVRVAASLLGTNEMLTPVAGREFAVQNLALNNVDLDTGSGGSGDVLLMIQARNGGDMTLALNNSSITGSLTPHFYQPSQLNFNVSGSSGITGWRGALSSVTALNVAPGGSLRIKNSGDLGSGALPTETLYFARFNNQAKFNNASLVIDASNLSWGKAPLTGDPKSSMTFTSNSSLQLTGTNSKLTTDDIVLQNSALTMANNTRMNLRGILTLDNSTANIGSGAVADVLEVIVKGASTATLTGQGLYSSFIDLRANPGSSLTIAGGGELTVLGGAGGASRIYFPQSGTGSSLHVTDDAYLVTRGSLTDVYRNSTLTTGSTASIDIQNESGLGIHEGATITNQGLLTVQSGGELQIFGNSNIGGTGTLNLNAKLSFGQVHPGQNSLTTANELNFGSDALVIIGFDSTARLNDFITANGTLSLGTLAKLQLKIYNDQELPLNIKFKLLDYSDSMAPLDKFSQFEDLPDGSVFSAGLNTFQINYNDATYEAGNASVITLTTVPEVSPGLLAGLGAVIALTGRRRRHAAN